MFKAKADASLVGVLQRSLNSGQEAVGSQVSRVPLLRLATAVLVLIGLDVAGTYAYAAELEEVIVTARKREESLQNVSAAVTAIGSGKLLDAGVTEIRDLQRIVPSLNIGEVVGLMKTTVRGLGNTSNVRGEDSEVVMHVDGVVVSRQELYSMAYFDLDRIEVLRGPQGTLYGRNSTGGTINLVTAKPTRDFEGYLNVGVGNYNSTKMEAALSGSLSERVQSRISLQSIQRDGYGKNITTGNDIDDEKRWAARLQFNFDISDDVKFLLSNEYATQNDASGLFSFLRVTYPDNQSPIPSSTNVLSSVGQGGFSDPNSRDGAGYFDPQLERETWSSTGTLSWALNDRFEVKTILNYRDMNFWLAQDLGLSSNISTGTGTAITYPTPALNGFPTAAVGVTLDDYHYSGEVQLVHEGDVFNRPLHAIGGVFYFKEHLDGSTNVGLFPKSGLRAVLLGDAETEAEAVFWNATYDLTRELSLRAGGRYTRESREIENHTFVPTSGALITPARANDEESFNKYTGEYGVDFRATDDVLFYSTYSQGFRSGAGLIMQSDSGIVKPTTVENQEVGIKTQWLGKTLQMNIALYKMKIKDLQRTKVFPSSTALIGFTTQFLNVATLNVKGVELDTNWALTDSFRLSAAVNYVDAKFGDYDSVDQLSPPPSVAVQVKGNRPALSPVWKGNLHGEYDFSLFNGTLTVGADASYTDKQYFDEFNRAPFEEDSYTLYDANLAYKPAEGNWKVSVWGRNLSDEKEIADTSISGIGRVLSKAYIRPLTYGVSADMRF